MEISSGLWLTDSAKGSGILLPESCSVIPQRPIASRAISLTNTFAYIKQISSNDASMSNEKSLSAGVLVDDKIYYQCFVDSTDTGLTSIRVFDTTTNTETTQSLGGTLHLYPSIHGITAYQNKLYLHCTDSDTALHEFEIGVWTNRTISTFTIVIVAMIQIGTSLAVLDSSGHIQYYDFTSETLAENTLAILDGISRNTQLQNECPIPISRCLVVRNRFQQIPNLHRQRHIMDKI